MLNRSDLTPRLDFKRAETIFFLKKSTRYEKKKV